MIDEGGSRVPDRLKGTQTPDRLLDQRDLNPTPQRRGANGRERLQLMLPSILERETLGGPRASRRSRRALQFVGVSSSIGLGCLLGDGVDCVLEDLPLSAWHEGKARSSQRLGES